MSLDENYCSFSNSPIHADYEKDLISFLNNFKPGYLTNTEVESKKRSNLFMEVFKFGDYLLLVVNVLTGW